MNYFSAVNDEEDEIGEDEVDGETENEIPEKELSIVIHKIGDDFGGWLELRKKTIARFNFDKKLLFH